MVKNIKLERFLEKSYMRNLNINDHFEFKYDMPKEGQFSNVCSLFFNNLDSYRKSDSCEPFLNFADKHKYKSWPTLHYA